MNIVLDTLFLRRPKLDYLSPAICEATVSSGGGYFISGSGGSIIFISDDGNPSTNDDPLVTDPFFLNTQQCVTVTCTPPQIGTPITVCKEAGLYISYVNQADADAQAHAAAESEANLAIDCFDECPPGMVWSDEFQRCIPICIDESCANGFVFVGDAYVCSEDPEEQHGVGTCLDLNTGLCIKDFTQISSLRTSLPTTPALPPDPMPDPSPPNCDLQTSDLFPNSNYGIVTAENVIADAPANPARIYTVTIRVRGVYEMKGYDSYVLPDSPPNDPHSGGRTDPQSPYLWIDSLNVIGGTSEIPNCATCNQPYSNSPENEYFFGFSNPLAVPGDPLADQSEAKRYYLNRYPGFGLVMQAVDFTFNVQLKNHASVVLYGWSVDSKEYYNPFGAGYAPIVVGGAPVALRFSEPYPGQFIQLDVIAIDYTV